MEKGIVKKIINDQYYIVKILLQEECNNCQIKEHCHGHGDDIRELRIKSYRKLNIDDEVEIFIKPQIRIVTSILIFLFPILCAFIFYFMSFELFKIEFISIISSFLGIVLAFLIVFIIVRKFKTLKTYVPIGEKIEEN